MWWNIRFKRSMFAFMFILLGASLMVSSARSQTVVTVDSRSPLLDIKIMIPAGSAHDPAGKEGLAYLTARMLIEGAFGDPDHPVTKDKLAEIVLPWGSGAYPSIRVSRETTVFSMKVPLEVLDDYITRILHPMFTRPLFRPRELDRLRNETIQTLRSIRLEQIELVGLMALDAYIHLNTSYAHPEMGTVRGLTRITPEDIWRFYATFYRPVDVTVGVTRRDTAIQNKIIAALKGMGMSRQKVNPFKVPTPSPPPPVRGREVVIIAMPNAISSGIHAGFPLPITRKDPDYWPLYVANIWFGTHRDSFSHLYQVIRAARGYNYGDYSYIEHFEGRPFYLFPPTNTPRRYQYFSIWIRPVDHQYVVHIMKALTWELENFIRTGLSKEQCTLAKNKARVLYLSLAETTQRILGYKIDDVFYGLTPGYLDRYLETIDHLTCDQINAAIRKYLQAENLKYVIVTDDDVAPRIVKQIVSNGPVWGKRPEDYQIEVKTAAGQKIYTLPEAKLKLLQQDAVWAHTWLDIPADRIRVIRAEDLFEAVPLPLAKLR